MRLICFKISAPHHKRLPKPRNHPPKRASDVPPPQPPGAAVDIAPALQGATQEHWSGADRESARGYREPEPGFTAGIHLQGDPQEYRRGQAGGHPLISSKPDSDSLESADPRCAQGSDLLSTNGQRVHQQRRYACDCPKSSLCGHLGYAESQQRSVVPEPYWDISGEPPLSLRIRHASTSGTRMPKRWKPTTKKAPGSVPCLRSGSRPSNSNGSVTIFHPGTSRWAAGCTMPQPRPVPATAISWRRWHLPVRCGYRRPQEHRLYERHLGRQ